MRWIARSESLATCCAMVRSLFVSISGLSAMVFLGKRSAQIALASSPSFLLNGSPRCSNARASRRLLPVNYEMEERELLPTNAGANRLPDSVVQTPRVNQTLHEDRVCRPLLTKSTRISRETGGSETS